MSAFENAKKFFHACETPLGWEGCKPYVAEGAAFSAQSEPLAEIDTVKAYCEWIEGFVGGATPGATYDLHASSYDEATKTAMATYSRNRNAIAPLRITLISRTISSFPGSADNTCDA